MVWRKPLMCQLVVPQLGALSPCGYVDRFGLYRLLICAAFQLIKLLCRCQPGAALWATLAAEPRCVRPLGGAEHAATQLAALLAALRL
jgi:hypothetical protein